MYRLSRIVLKSPVPCAAVLVALTLFFAFGALRVHREFGYRTLLGSSYPPIVTLEAFVERYSGGFPVYIVWSCGENQPCASVFEEHSIRMASSIEDSLRSAAGVRNVRGPASASLVVPAADGFMVRRFFELDGFPPDAPQLAARALSDPLWVGTFVSETGRVGAIVVLLTDAKSKTMEHVIDTIEVSLAPFRTEGFEFHLAGHPVASVVAGRELAENTASLVPFIAIVIALVILALTRSLQATLVTMLTMGVGLLWTLGFLGWMRWPQDTLLQVLAPLILIVGVCDAVHVLSRYATKLAGRADRREREQAVLSASKEIAVPCMLTTLTTGGAFISFTTSDLDTFVRFGTVCAFGVISCLILTFSLLPLLVTWLPVRAPRPIREVETWQTVAEAIARTSQRRRVPILVASTVLCVLCAVGWALYLRVDTQPEEMFGEQSKTTRWDRFVGAHLRGSDSLEVNISLPPGAPLRSPDTQAVLTRFSEFLRGTEGLGRTVSVQDLISRLNRALHDDDPRFEAPSDTVQGNAEILELLAMDDREALEVWATADGSEVRISAEGLASTSMDRGRVLEVVRRYVDEQIPADWRVSLTGPFALSYDWVSALQSTQLRSFATAFFLVLVLTAVFLRSPWLGLAAMVPALLPVLVILGLMGFAGMSLDVGRVMIAAVVIGIAVDDAVHLLSRYRIERERGLTRRTAISQSLVFVARPVVVTSVALALGFFTLTISSWQTISSFGFFVSLAILAALVATLFVLPAIFFALDGGEIQRADPAGNMASPRPPPAKVLPTLLVLLLPGAAFCGVTLEIAREGASKQIDCWVLPNGRIVNLPGSGCPLESNDQLRGAKVQGEIFAPVYDLDSLRFALERAESTVQIRALRSGHRISKELAVRRVTAQARAKRTGAAFVIAALLVSVPLLVLWRSNSAAAVPLAFFYASVSVIAILLLSTPSSTWLLLVGASAAIAAPASLTHLALTFPKERDVIRAIPELGVIPYAASAALIPVGWVALKQNAALWPTFVALQGALAAGAWVMLAVSCALALRESPVPLERSRARLLLSGTLLLPVLPAVALFDKWSPSTTYLVAAAVVMPMPVALAVSRYNLFDLGDDVRAAAARLLYVALMALTVTIVLGITDLGPGLADPIVVFALCFVSVLAVEWIRGRTLGLLESLLSPRARKLREIYDAYFEQIETLQGEQHVAALLARSLEEALHPRALAVFLRREDDWISTCARGKSAPAHVELAERAASLLARRRFLHLVQETDSGADSLRRLGVELIAAIRQGENIEGLVLVTGSSRGSTYGAIERRFAARAVQQASIAIRNARLAMDLVAKERHAATGRTALALLHEVRKGMDWIVGLSRRLSKQLENRPDATPDLRDIEGLSLDMIETLESFVRDATREVPRTSGQLACDQLIDRAIGALERRYGGERILRTVDPKVLPVPVSQDLERVLVNIMDNALLASPAVLPVHVWASLERGCVQIRVADRGPGMDPDTLARCFEAGFSTRKGNGGSGFGLTVSRRIIESLGGTIGLVSRSGRGTRVTISLPAANLASADPVP